MQDDLGPGLPPRTNAVLKRYAELDIKLETS